MRDADRRPTPDAPDGPRPPTAPTPPAPIEVVDGPVLCRLRVWTESEWPGLPEADRPARAAHFPGLGWVGAVPVRCLN